MEEYRTSIFEYDSVKNAIAYSERKGMEKARIEMAKECFRKGLSVEVTAAVTKLSLEQTQTLTE
jgi:hypothetical protein